MAVISVSGVLDGTTVYSDLTVTLSNRTASSVTVSYTIVTHLTSSGYSGAGYESYTGKVAFSGSGMTSQSQSITVKSKSEGWSGSANHTVTGSFTLSLSTTSAFTASVTYTLTSSADSVHSASGATTVSVSAYVAPVPSNPSYVTVASTICYGDTMSVAFGTVSGATAYAVYMKKGSGSYGLLGRASSSPYTNSALDISPGESLTIKVCAENSSGASSGKESSAVTVIGGIRINVSGSYKIGTAYVNKNGVWHKAKSVNIYKSGWQVGK